MTCSTGLSFEVLFIPPLRERREDILLLANYFGGRMAQEVGWAEPPEITEPAAQKMEDYPWPGNVRELKNVIERAVYRSDDYLITDDEIVFDPFESPYAEASVPARAGVVKPPAKSTNHETDERPVALDRVATLLRLAKGMPFEDAVSEFEVAILRDALGRARYNQRNAAESLGLTYHQFRGLYRKYGDALKE